MTYDNIVKGIFLERINRFIAKVLINDKEELVHVKNTGRCKELFISGANIFLEKSNNPKRKTKYSLISIYKGDRLINIDSQVPNAVVYEGIASGKLKEFKGLVTLKREVSYGSSRFDLYYETKDKKGFIEVKGVTLEEDGIARFPDAPTERGRKHIRELIQATEEGYQNYIFFLIQMEGISKFEANHRTDPAFSQILLQGMQKNVGIILFDSIVEDKSISLNNRFFFE